MPSSPENYRSSLYWCVCQLMSWGIDTLLLHCSAQCVLYPSILREYIVWINHWAIQQFNTAEEIHRSCILCVMNLAYKSVAEVVLRSMPAVNTQAASRTQNANVFNKGLLQRYTHLHTLTCSVSAPFSLYSFFFLNIIQHLPDLKCISQLHGSCPIYAEYIGIRYCSQPRQQAGWLHGWLTFNVNSRFMFRATALGLSNDNSRVGHTTSVITLSAKRDVMIVKLLPSAPFTEQSNKLFYCQATRSQRHTQWHTWERQRHTHTLTSLNGVHSHTVARKWNPMFLGMN